MLHDPARARAALAAYGRPRASLTPLTMGLINETWRADGDGEALVLQRLNPIFSPEIHHDIAAIGAHLRRAGLRCARLLPTAAGTLWHADPGGAIWRLQDFIPGTVHAHVAEPAPCSAAGRLLGRFHRALWDLQHRFAAPRLGVHDTPRHLARLAEAVAAHPQHVAHAAVREVAAGIVEALGPLPDLSAQPQRIVHGDPKLSNVVFGPDGEAVALIDLDTLNHMPLALELGDALRSWCNPDAEGSAAAAFSLPHFTCALEGYSEGIAGLLTAAEVALLPGAPRLIALELAARFSRDALEERYFGWDATRYAAPWEHHLARARGQLALGRSLAAQAGAMQQVVAGLFPGGR